MKKEFLCLALDTDVRSFIKSARVLLCPFPRNLRVVFLYFFPLFTLDLRLSSAQLGQDDSLINVPFTVRLHPISAVNIRARVSGRIEATFALRIVESSMVLGSPLTSYGLRVCVLCSVRF